MNKIPPHIRYLVLLLTTRCNLSCRYCYRPDNAEQLDMSSKIMRSAVGIAASHGNPFHVQLTGGEPCLNRDLLFQTVKLLRSFVPWATIAIQTNATLLDDELACFFKEYAVQVGVSIDGSPLIHQKARGMIDKVLAGIESLEAYEIPWRATAVVTADSVEYLWKLVLFISRFKTASGIALDFLTRKSNAIKNCVFPATPEAIEHGVAKLLKTLETVNGFRSSPIRFREADTIAGHLRLSKSKEFCHACTGESMAVCPDGSVYPCSQLSSEQAYCAGNVCDTIDWTMLRLGVSNLQGDECSVCPLNGKCPGDCPSRLVYNNVNEQRAVCALYRTIYAFQNKGQIE